MEKIEPVAWMGHNSDGNKFLSWRNTTPPKTALYSQATVDQLVMDRDYVKEVEFPRKMEAIAEGWRKKLAATEALLKTYREALELAVAFKEGGTQLARNALATTPQAALNAAIAEELERVTNSSWADTVFDNLRNRAKELQSS